MHPLSSVNYDVAKKLVDAAALQQQACASNIANLETPNYKRLKVSASFENALQKAQSGGDLSSIQSLTPSLEHDLTSTPTRQDGNNVDLDNELMLMSNNALAYRYATKVLSSSIQQLNAATKGQSGSLI